jgi:hypothetical protein
MEPVALYIRESRIGPRVVGEKTSIDVNVGRGLCREARAGLTWQAI